MDATHLEELIQLEDSYWWHVAKRQLVSELLAEHFPPPGKLVEGGVGSARNLIEFRAAGYEVAGLDVMPAAVAHARQRGVDEVFEHDLGEPWPLAEASTRVVVLLDVLEHLADPVTVLRHARRTLEPGGGIVLTVPAYRWLFGDWDRSLGHFRRYSSRELRRQAAEAGFQVSWLSYWNAFTLPAACSVRGYQRCFPRQRTAEFPRVRPATNAMLLGMANAERWLMRKTGVPCGLSLVAVLTTEAGMF